MSLFALRSLFDGSTGPENGDEEKPEPDIVIEEDEDLAGAIESWFEKGDEFDRRHGGFDSHAG
jgi:hypothetical protein